MAVLNVNNRRDQPTTHLKLPTTQLFSNTVVGTQNAEIGGGGTCKDMYTAAGKGHCIIIIIIIIIIIRHL
jgi:hypothetical protein